MPQDAINLAQCRILQSPDVRQWPVTTALTRIEFSKKNVRVEFTKKDGADRWPDAVSPGWDGPLQYTLWVILTDKVTQTLPTCGAIQMWHGRDGVGGPFSKGSEDWWMRIPAMMGIQPQPGDRVGFFVAAGDCRLRAEPTSVHERSNIVLVTVPPDDTGTFEFSADVPVVPAPIPATATDLIREDIKDLKSYVASMDGGITSWLGNIERRLTALEAKKPATYRNRLIGDITPKE